MGITKNWKNILSIGLAVLVLFGAVGAVASFATNDSKPAGAVFKVGGLDPETGKYVKTDKTIYTETAIDAYGLRIEPDFECTATYDVYLYDGVDNLLSSELGLEDVYECKDELFAFARIVIHPEMPEDVKEKDFKIHFWNIPEYSAMLKITNSKEESKYDFKNLFVKEKVLEGYTQVSEIGSSINAVDVDEKTSITDVINLNSDYNYYDIYVFVVMPPQSSIYVSIADKNGSIIGNPAIDLADANSTGWYKITVDVDEYKGATSMRVVLPIDYHNCYIYGYND